MKDTELEKPLAALHPRLLDGLSFLTESGSAFPLRFIACEFRRQTRIYSLLDGLRPASFRPGADLRARAERAPCALLSWREACIPSCSPPKPWQGRAGPAVRGARNRRAQSNASAPGARRSWRSRSAGVFAVCLVSTRRADARGRRFRCQETAASRAAAGRRVLIAGALSAPWRLPE